jgi:hypothetical protein
MCTVNLQNESQEPVMERGESKPGLFLQPHSGGLIPLLKILGNEAYRSITQGLSKS